MARVYQFVSPALESPEMSLDFEGAVVQLRFFDALGAQDIAAYLTWYSGRLDAPFLRPPP